MTHLRRAIVVLIWGSVAAAMGGFCLPWARIDLHEPDLVKQLRQNVPAQEALHKMTKQIGRVAVKIRRGAETITGDLPSLSDIPKQVSGLQIPQLANQKNAQVAVALLEMFTKTRQHLGLKSYAVYLVPGMAFLCGLLLTFCGRRLAVTVGVAGLGAVVAGVGFWKLLTTNTKTLLIAITIGPGLWLSLWAYTGLAVAAGLLILLNRRRA